MKKELVAAFLFAFATLAQAGIIMEERPASLSFQPTDKFAINGIIMDERVKTSFGQTLERGTYVLTVEGTGRTNELLISFSLGMGQPPVGTTKATIATRSMPGGSRSGAQAVSMPTAVELGPIDPATARASSSHPVFSNLGFSTLSRVTSSREGAQKKLTIESASPGVNVVVETKLTVMP